MHRRSSVRDSGRRPTPAFPPAPPYDLQASHSVVSIEADPSRPTGRMVFLDGHESSYVDLADPTHLEFSYMRRIGDVIDLIRPARQPLDVLHVGGGGFTLPRYVAATRPRSRQVVFEYDAGLVRIAREHLGLAASPGLRVRVGDARARLAERPDASADLVIGDAFSGVVVPAHLATLEFAREVRRVLRPDGVYLLNVIDCPPLRVSRAEATTLLAAFGEIGLVADRDLLRERDAGNVVFMAADVPLPLDGVRRAAARGAHPDDVLDRAEVVRFAGSAPAATDATLDRWARIAPPADLPVPLYGE
jgi:SAM-dependent methyltransferase